MNHERLWVIRERSKSDLELERRASVNSRSRFGGAESRSELGPAADRHLIRIAINSFTALYVIPFPSNPARAYFTRRIVGFDVHQSCTVARRNSTCGQLQNGNTQMICLAFDPDLPGRRAHGRKN